MPILRKAENRVHWYFNELGARVVAESGTPGDRQHLGKLVLRSLKDAPDFLLQIDAATEESEDFKSVLQRSVKCAVAFREIGLVVGDNMVIMAPNHIHTSIPYYAALYSGVGIAPLDMGLTTMELQSMFQMVQPKIVFCQSEKADSVLEALKLEKLDCMVVTFDESKSCMHFDNFMDKYGVDANVETYKASDFDPVETIAVLLPTSGTTGLPKTAALTHTNISISFPYIWSFGNKFPTPTRIGLVISPLQWLTAIVHYTLSPIMRYTRVQTSGTITTDNIVPIVNKYKPTYTIISPPFLTTLTKPENVAICDISCFELIYIGGSAVSKELLDRVKEITPNTSLVVAYGMSEIGMGFHDADPPAGSVGRPYGIFDYRLVNPDTKEDITEPHVTGELWVRGPSICKGYYNKPEATKESFVEDGWFRTGDMLYRDEHYFFYFVERLKMLLKYRNHQISPVEIESVIRKHPAVLDVAVAGLAHAEHGELPVACVVVRSGHQVTAQEIKDLVKNSLVDSKQLRGGVVFMKELPMTATTKVHRRLLKEMLPKLHRE